MLRLVSGSGAVMRRLSTFSGKHLEGKMDSAEIGKNLEEFRRTLAMEVGTAPDCPFCQRPRVRRGDYIRCNPCGVNWLDQEMHLPSYLNRNPAAARMVVTVSKPAEK